MPLPASAAGNCTLTWSKVTNEPCERSLPDPGWCRSTQSHLLFPRLQDRSRRGTSGPDLYEPRLIGCATITPRPLIEQTCSLSAIGVVGAAQAAARPLPFSSDSPESDRHHFKVGDRLCSGGKSKLTWVEVTYGMERASWPRRNTESISMSQRTWWASAATQRRAVKRTWNHSYHSWVQRVQQTTAASTAGAASREHSAASMAPVIAACANGFSTNPQIRPCARAACMSGSSS